MISNYELTLCTAAIRLFQLAEITAWRARGRHAERVKVTRKQLQLNTCWVLRYVGVLFGDRMRCWAWCCSVEDYDRSPCGRVAGGNRDVQVVGKKLTGRLRGLCWRVVLQIEKRVGKGSGNEIEIVEFGGAHIQYTDIRSSNFAVHGNRCS